MNRLIRIRIGLATLVIGGLLGLGGLLLRGQVPFPNLDVDAWAQAVTGSNYVLAQILTILAYVIPYLGFWAIYALLEQVENVEKLAFWGFMFSIIGTSLAIATLGIFSFVSPQIAVRYLQGDAQLPSIISQVVTGQAAIINLSGGILYLLGTVLLGLAIWRSRSLPKWSGLLITLNGIFLVFGFLWFPISLLSWVYILGAGLWLLVGPLEQNDLPSL